MTEGAILVLGATGRTGRMIVSDLRRRGLAVRALVRDPVAAREVLGEAVDMIAGDLRRREDLAAAAAGVGGIVFAAAAFGDPRRGSPQDIDHGAVRALAELLDPDRIDRIVLLSSAGATQPEHPHNCSFDSVLKWKFRGEEALRRSALPYTIVRALGLRDRPAGQQGVRMLQGDRIAFGEDIARADVAAFLAGLVAPEDATACGFDPAFDPTSLRRATFEIYNDRTVPGFHWTSDAQAFLPDPIPASVH